MLLRKQQNILLTILQNLGLPIQGFQNENYESRHSVNYADEDRDFSFEITPGRSDAYQIIMSPGLKSMREAYSADEWESVQRLFVSWATSLKDEIEAPDLWAEAAAQIASSIEPFTLAEAKELQKQLKQLQAEVSTLSLTAAEQTVVQQVLADESKALSALPDKKSWMKAFSTKLSDGLATTLTSPETLAGVAQWIYKALIAAVPTLAAAAAAHHLLN